LRFLVFLATGTSQITAHYAFHRQRLGFPYHHRAPGKLLTERLQFFGELIEPRRDEVISNIVESLEPERRNLIEHCALERNWIGKNHVGGGDPVRDDKEQGLAQVEHFADLAAAQFLDFGEID